MITTNMLTGLPYYKNYKEYGHWIYAGEGLENAFGFTYVITNLTNQKKYIGCKQIKMKNKGKQNWHDYMGSNKTLLEDIKLIGKNHFLFEVVGVYQNKTDLRMAEAKWILSADALNRKDYYNEYLQLRIRVHPNNKKESNTTLPKLKVRKLEDKVN